MHFISVNVSSVRGKVGQAGFVVDIWNGDEFTFQGWDDSTSNIATEILHILKGSTGTCFRQPLYVQKWDTR